MKLAGGGIRRVPMPLGGPVRASFGTETARDILLLRVAASGTDGVSGEAEGWGECVAMSDPLYSSEYVDAAAEVLCRFLIPKLVSVTDLDGAAVGGALEPFKGHWM